MTRKRLLVALMTLCLAAFVVMIAGAAFPQAKAPETVILKGSPLGGVKLEHKLHAETRGIKCETCHHPSKPEKPASAPQQACTSCHTRPAKPPMKTNIQAAFHNPSATAGTCIACHKAENAKGKAAPVKCMDCHKNTNV